MNYIADQLSGKTKCHKKGLNQIAKHDLSKIILLSKVLSEKNMATIVVDVCGSFGNI